jgi:hypothetical protein
LAPVQQAANVSHRPGKAAHDANRAQRPIFEASPGTQSLSLASKVEGSARRFYMSAVFLVERREILRLLRDSRNLNDVLKSLDWIGLHFRAFICVEEALFFWHKWNKSGKPRGFLNGLKTALALGFGVFTVEFIKAHLHLFHLSQLCHSGM